VNKGEYIKCGWLRAWFWLQFSTVIG